MSAALPLPAVHASWFAGLDAGLVALATTSPLGRRLLYHELDAVAPHLLSPRHAPDVAGIWSVERLDALALPLGALIYGPAIRAVVHRNAVRRLKGVLGDGYRLALDASLLAPPDDADLALRMRTDLAAALDADEAAPRELLCRAGLVALQAWADAASPALAEWLRLRRPREEPMAPVRALPADLVAALVAHHGGSAT
ncbi:hypothetical protein [Coralloluteibacterium stylophorae]|uniref:Type III secretion protein n=1 Tax=Coralloluteibacterium stylophorae TaxID=1776034 RepID=A0A8J7VTJ0_9GAMM|nr:hypothetical protein [Coralloluteibacterium stylophorae]MBS7458777.1 hypothetical protein [Coralloluteibacterium stylophorae]